MITVRLHYATIKGGLFNEIEAKENFKETKLRGFIKVLDTEFDYDKMKDSQICETMFMMTNGEGENPLATTTKQEFIKKKALHTSLSVGDIVVIGRDGYEKTYLCKSMGWEDLTIKVKPKQPDIT